MRRILLVCSIIICSTASAQDATFRGNAEHTGVYAGQGVPQFSRIEWQFHTDGQVMSSPAVTADTVYIGSDDHFLYALARVSGKQKWKFKTESRITSSPSVSGGVVYFGSFDGNFYAVDARNGQLKWKFGVPGERRFTATHLHGSLPAAEAMPDPFDFFLSSPVVWNGAVYFGSGDTNVYALDAASGQVKWKFKTGDVVHASPAISNGALFVGSWDSNFYALDAATGAEKWRFKTGEDADIHNQVGIQSSAAVADGVVYFGCRDSKFYAVDAATGKQRWSFDNKGSWVIGSPAVTLGRVYYATSDSGMFYALDAQSGAPVFSMNYKDWPMFSSPAIAGEMAYIGSHQGKLFAINLKTQKVAWAFETDSSKRNGPSYTKADGKPNYEAAFSDSFYDNMVVGVQKLLSVGAILSSPVIAGDVIYVGSSDGNVYALK